MAGPRAEDIRQAEAQLAANQATRDLIRQQLTDAELKAPVDGVVRARLLEPGEETTPDGAFTVQEDECLGACDAAPVVQIDYANHDRVTPERMGELVEALRSGDVPAPSRGAAPRDFRHASRVLAGVDEPA